MTEPRPYRGTTEVLTELLDLAGKDVVDVGSGDGAITRLMTRNGARVIGIECTPEQLDKARAAAPEGGERYLTGVGQDLPLPDASADVVVFFHSLHHVPPDKQDKALAEAARVLRPGGRVYVAEPLAEGPHYELARPIDDEAEVRASAYRAVGNAGAHGLSQDREMVFIHRIKLKDFEAFRERIVGPDPQRRRPAFAEMEDRLRAAFDRLSEREDDAYTFDQPIRVNLLRKTS